MTGPRRPDREGALLPWLKVLAGLGAVVAVLTPVALALRPDRATTDRAAGATGSTAVTATDPAPGTDTTLTPTPSTSSSTTTTTSVPLAADDGKRSDERRLEAQFEVRNDDLQPKSIVASGSGLVTAQNMMYRHNVMMFDRSGAVLARIDDTVDLAAFGIEGGVVAQGSPVEAVFTPDDRFVYVSNYKMYGSGFNPVASDDCNEGDWDDSYVYKIDTTTFTIVAVIPTGSVPKFMAISPDGSRLLVSNWCGFDVTIVDLATDTPITRVHAGRHPRGIAITADSRTAYVAVMGDATILRLDLSTNTVVGTVGDVGTTPRHLLLSPDGRYLYVSNHRQNLVRKIDLAANRTIGTASTGTETRSMAIADDGESLYVVNYQDGTVSKVRTSDMEILQTLPTGVHPVGITYDPATRQVWVANYAGSLSVFVDR